ncbi:hypothetical protein Zmor_019317 [Zophobas morio]|uniref:protein-tyrosine-phosphatase n=1 Tax=Zophobas morio TaxID=2755281 RepID=A0AA38M933_9CUCU|nr:hypothetical protein Zmor_019317 [Zophobas morio]
MPKWTEITFVKRATEAKSVKFAIITTGEITSHSYWDIQEIQQCGENGLRMIQLDMMPNCQLLNSDNKVISLDNAVTPSYADKYTKCAENTVSTHCVPCDSFLNEDCGQLKVCENNQNGLLCSCSAGYKTGKKKINCQTRCDFGTYGHHCSKTCNTHCMGNCNFIDGTCKSCSNDYMGPKCEIAPTPFFKNSPKIKKIGYTNAEILVDNFELERFSDTDSSRYEYTVQYKETNSTEWTLHSDSADVGMSHTFKIKNLKPGVKYFVRSTIKKYVGNFSDSIPRNDFITKCDALKSEDFQVEPTNTTAYITVKLDSKFKICKLKNSETSIEIQPNVPKFSYHLEDMTLNINGLYPFENFTLTIKNNNTIVKIPFSTTEGVPGNVTNVVARATSDSKIDVKWKAPPKLHGNFQDFVVSYKIIKYLTCDAAPTHLEELTEISTDPSITLSNLNPYTLYSISVKARNTKLSGLEEKVEQNTPQSDTIRDQEIPKASLKKTNSRSVEFEFSSVPCSNLGGPIEVVTNAVCLTVWCKDQNVSNSFTYPQHKTLTLNSLAPFTNYQLTFGFHRNNFSKIITFGSFETKTESPYAVNNLSVYSKNTHSISVRWRPPSPPTGILKLYLIKLLEKAENISVTNVPCFLWPEYQCYTLKNLSENMNYSVQLSAKNEEPDNFGQTSLVKAITKIEPSEKPPDVMVKWTLENYLDIRWKHPVVANGEIQSFKIRILQLSSKNKRIDTSLNITKDQYKPTYQKIVKSQDIRTSTNYKIVVEAFNGMEGKEGYVTDLSPPEIPVLEREPKIVNVSNITITLQVEKNKNINNNNTYKLFLLVSNANLQSDSYPPELQNFENNFGISLSPVRVIYECNSLSTTKQFVIGQNGSVTNCKQVSNISLTTGTSYNVTVMLVSTYRDKSSYKLYSKSALTSGESSNTPRDLTLLALLLLLLIIPIVIFIYIKRRPITEKFTSFKTNMFGNDPLLEETGGEDTPLATVLKPAENTKVYSKKIPLSSFVDYVKESLNNNELKRQHELFPRGQTKPWDYGAIKENKSKNRYNNLIAYDHTRVILKKISGKPHSDYINANYIDGYKVKNAFIATQGPKLSTVNDFWRMIWQEGVQHIAMLANIQEGGKKKVEKYWPDKHETLPFQDITVYYISSEMFADYEHRRFRVVCKDETREVQQYHFLSWPDHGVPLYSQSLIPFLMTLQSIQLDSKSPIVVHCSAGVGRTGTIILCDTCLRMAAEENCVDVLKTLQQLRDQRPNMVDNIQQYKLAHLVIVEYFFGMYSGLSCQTLNAEVKKLIKGGGIKKQMSYLDETAWQDQTMKSVANKSDKFVIVKEKNREQTIVPECQGCIFLSRYPLDDEASTYINAVRVDGFQCPGRFIVTQQPMQNTLGDFWRLIHAQETSLIISLNEINLNNKSSCHFWPSTEQAFKPVDYITLKLANISSSEFHDLISVHMHVNDSNEYKLVEIMALKTWPARTNCPKNIKNFLSFYESVNVESRQSKPVVVTCFDGALACGLYVALTFIIEKINLEQLCDVCQAVRTVRHNRSQFVRSEEQFEFLYKAAVAYVEGFQDYANFS